VYTTRAVTAIIAIIAAVCTPMTTNSPAGEAVRGPRIVGDDQSTCSHQIRELLNRNGIPYGFHQTGSASANRLIEQRGTEIKATTRGRRREPLQDDVAGLHRLRP
jgi:hypothetical protein